MKMGATIANTTTGSFRLLPQACTLLVLWQFLLQDTLHKDLGLITMKVAALSFIIDTVLCASAFALVQHIIGRISIGSSVGFALGLLGSMLKFLYNILFL